MSAHATILGHAPLLITAETVANVWNIVESSHLDRFSPDQLHAHLLSHSTPDGLCSRQAFAAAFSFLPKGHQLFSIFEDFDRQDCGNVDMAEIAIGLSLICHGSKSQKLAAAFSLLDEDEDECLTRRGTWRLIHSFLAVLLRICNYWRPQTPKKEVLRILDSMSVATASEILATGNSQKTTFDGLSLWYARSGCITSSFIEILDLRKIRVPNQQHEQVPGEDEEDEEEKEKVGQIVYSVQLLDGHKLVIKATDTMRVFAISEASGMDAIEASELASLLKEYEGPENCIQAPKFLEFLEILIPEALTEQVRNGLVKTLFQIFRLYEEHSTFAEGGADLRWLSVGLSLFCAGNKSVKLGNGFGIFDIDDVGYLSKTQLMCFLASLLLMMTALGCVNDPSIAVSAASFVSDEVCKSIGGERISFEAFGIWYNSKGFQLASYIEILCLEKWRIFTPFTPGMNADDEDKDDDDEEAFSISLHGPDAEKVLTVSKNCALQVIAFKRSFLLNFDSFASSLANVTSDGLIRKAAFESVLVRAGPHVCASLHGSGSFLLRLFDLYDRSGSRCADTVELLTGILVLIDGSKSNKLALAFSLFDAKDTGVLTRSEMIRMIRSFLGAIMLLSALPPKDTLQIVLDDSAQWCVDDILSFLDPRGRNDKVSISFSELSLYYSRRISVDTRHPLNYNNLLH